MSQRVTVKDVAAQAGVSVATVSYIMNNRTDVKISDATRKKVLQIANLLNYTPSAAAKSLVTGKNFIIGVSYRLVDNSPSRNLEITGFVNLLIERLNRMNYDVMFIPVIKNDDNLPVRKNIDGIIAIDLSEQEFRDLSGSYLVPVIAVDMIVNDDLFYQIHTNFSSFTTKKLSEDSDSVLVMEKYVNENYMDYICNNIPDNKLCIIDAANMPDKKFFNGKHIIALGTYLALMIKPYVDEKNLTAIASDVYMHILPDNITVVESDATKKANVAINLMLNAIDRKFEVNHIYEINID